jgi:hypothetical protein
MIGFIEGRKLYMGLGIGKKCFKVYIPIHEISLNKPVWGHRFPHTGPFPYPEFCSMV